MIERDMLVESLGVVYTVIGITVSEGIWNCNDYLDNDIFKFINEKDFIRLNPFPDIMKEKLFRLLYDLNLFSKTDLRGITIKRKYLELKKIKFGRPSIILEKIAKDYPHIQFDTVRKACYVGMPLYKEKLKKIGDRLL